MFLTIILLLVLTNLVICTNRQLQTRSAELVEELLTTISNPYNYL
ncbi:hypothetical protein [Agathobacter rectalis]|nr:hypothetical protein [Agathobacter rectalis]